MGARGLSLRSTEAVPITGTVSYISVLRTCLIPSTCRAGSASAKAFTWRRSSASLWDTRRNLTVRTGRKPEPRVKPSSSLCARSSTRRTTRGGRTRSSTLLFRKRSVWPRGTS